VLVSLQSEERMQRILTAAVIAGGVALATSGLALAQTGTSPAPLNPNGITPGLTDPTAVGPANAAAPSADQIRQIQQQLQAQGLYNGPIDGRMGPQTEAGLSRFQQQNGLPQTNSLDQATLSRLTNGAATGSGSSIPPANPGGAGDAGPGGGR
jgi:peptidoglycan hydrolase-like protein with peptidoglycan-binding domain